MASQTKPDVDENAAQVPGETNKVTGEVDVEENVECGQLIDKKLPVKPADSPRLALEFMQKSTTTHGRGLFATQAIAKDHLIHTCETPYAFTIQRDFRKEVCGQCFAYSFDIGRRTWSVRSGTGHGVWLCSEACRDSFEAGNIGGIIGLTNSSIENVVAKMKKNRAKIPAHGSAVGHHDVLHTELDSGWKAAENHKQKPTDAVQLNDTELDIARLVANAVIRRYIEDNSPPGITHLPPRWEEYMDLQDHEFLHVRARPYIFDTNIRVYQFLRVALPVVLQPYLVSSETVRATLGRVSSNAMGIWQLSPTLDEGELLGWGVYVSGSYFNHNCEPNVRKLRVGRAMKFYATRNIEVGEELCINYVSLEDSVEERRRCLREHWYFHCVCKRCHEESSISLPAADVLAPKSHQ